MKIKKILISLLFVLFALGITGEKATANTQWYRYTAIGHIPGHTLVVVLFTAEPLTDNVDNFTIPDGSYVITAVDGAITCYPAAPGSIFGGGWDFGDAVYTVDGPPCN